MNNAMGHLTLIFDVLCLFMCVLHLVLPGDLGPKILVRKCVRFRSRM